MTKPEIVFFGSGPVASKSLELLKNSFNIELVITKPRPPHHKGAVPVLDLANNLKLPVKTANNKYELDELITKCNLNSRLAVLIDYGIIVSQSVIDFFPLGIINSHFSLLPRWRGADPISFSILGGDPKTGVSLMLVDIGMDTGKILAQRTYKLSKNITTPSLTKELINLSNQLLNEYVPRYINGEIKPRRQSHPDRATYSRKLTKTDGLIDWNKPAITLEQEIRAYLGWPSSRTTLFGKEVIITQASVMPNLSSNFKVGDVFVVKNIGLLRVATSDGSLCIQKLKPTGKREMTAKEFITGYYKN